MKTDVRLLSLRNLLLLESALLLQHARLILSQVASFPSDPNSSSAETTTSTHVSTDSTCAPCTVSVRETMLSFPWPVIESTTTATATVIPYITAYPDGTNVTFYSTYSAYVANASSHANFTTPASTPLVWTTLGFTLTYPTTYVAFPRPEAGRNSDYAVSSIPSCHATNLTAIPNIPAASLLFPYNEATTSSSQVSAVGSGSPLTSIPASSSPLVPIGVEDFTSSLFSYLDTLPQLSSIVSTNPRLCSQTVAAGEAAAVIGGNIFLATAAVDHITVFVLTQTGQAVVDVATAVPEPVSGERGSNTEGSPGGGENPRPSGGAPKDNNGNSVGLGTVTPADLAATAVVTSAPTGEYISIGPTSFLVSAAQNGGSSGGGGGVIIVGGGYATLAPGSGIAINGVPVSYELSGSTTALVVGGSTIPVGVTTVAAAAGEGVLTVGSSTITAGPNGAFVISGQTLYPGQQITIGGSTVGGQVYGGTTISLAVGGKSAVVNGQTETLATATATGNAVTSGSSASVNAASTKGHSGSLNTHICWIALVFGVVGALAIAL